MKGSEEDETEDWQKSFRRESEDTSSDEAERRKRCFSGKYITKTSEREQGGRIREPRTIEKRAKLDRKM